MRKKLWIAVGIMFLVNLPLLLGEFTMKNWDSQTHLFHASHYLNGWFDPWEEQWYTGFWMFGYPPLVHQLIAMFSPWFGLEVSYRLVQGVALLFMPLAIALFAREIVDEDSASIAALLSPGLAGVYVVLYTFGQLPFFVGAVASFIAVRFLFRYLKKGSLLELCGWFFSVGTVVALHHQTILFVTSLAVVSTLVVWVKEGLGLKILLRTVAAVVLMVLAVSLVIAPFWWWYTTQQVTQVPIPHPTRENIFRNVREARIFFWDMYGGLLVLLPLLVLGVLRRRELLFVGGLACFLALLGLGGVTKIPQLAFADFWEVLTYERFTFWATVLSLIPIGVGLRTVPKKQWVHALVAIVLVVGVAKALAFQNKDDILPEPLKRWEEEEIVKFLDQHSNWRYVTFGLGEPQVVRLSRLTVADTVDGFFNQVRWRRLQVESGIGTIDSSPWVTVESYGVLFPMLQRPWEWSLRWAVVKHSWVHEHLRNSGWKLLHPVGSDANYQEGNTFKSLVTLWEAPNDIPIPPTQSEAPQDFRILSFWWGIVPLAVLVASVWVLFFSLKGELCVSQLSE